MMPLVDDKENHEEIDLIDNHQDQKNESSDRQSSNRDSSDDDDDDDDDDDERQDSNNNSSTFFPKKIIKETYEHKPEPEPSLEDIIEKKKHMLYELKD